MVNRLQTIVYDSINVVHILAWHTTYTISEVNLYDLSEIEFLNLGHFRSFESQVEKGYLSLSKCW